MIYNQPIVSLTNVSFSYHNKPFLQNINLNVYTDDFLGMIGPNGGGKTTLVKLILGLLTPNSGNITVFGQAAQKGRGQIGYLAQFDEVDIDFPINAFEIVLLGRLSSHITHQFNHQDKEAAEKALAQLGIWHLRDKPLSELSGGEMQKVFLARSLVAEPQLLILDEPLNNLDATTRQDFYKLLKKLNQHMAIIVIDHNLEMLAQYVTKIACVNKCIEKSLEHHDIQKIDPSKLLEL